MKPSKPVHYAVLIFLMSLTVAACDGDEAVELTTTSSLVATPSESTTTSAPTDDGTTTTLVGEAVADYEIVARESGSAGETLYIVIPPGAYTDVDIENFVLDLFESGTATYDAEIFDDAAAVEAYRKPEADRTEADTALIDQHHFASLINGTTIHFQGPFESSGELIIGS